MEIDHDRACRIVEPQTQACFKLNFPEQYCV
jgi:hypothetical protein